MNYELDIFVDDGYLDDLKRLISRWGGKHIEIDQIKPERYSITFTAMENIIITNGTHWQIHGVYTS